MDTLVTNTPDTSSLLARDCFAEQTLNVLTRLRGALADTMTIIPGGVQKSQDIQKRLGLSFNLSWQIYRIMRAEHPLEISPHVPTARSMKKLFSALAKNGVSRDALSKLESAHTAFDEHVKKSSGNRGRFDAIATPMGGGVTDSQVEHTHRRALFESHRYVTGIEQDLFVTCLILHPSKSHPNCADQISLTIRKNLQRLRPDTEIVVDGTWIRKDAPAVDQVRSPLPLDVDAYKKYGFYVLPEYCSQPDLVLKQELTPEGLFLTKWAAGGVGQPNAIDVVGGVYIPATPMQKDENGAYSRPMWTNVVKPTQKMVLDLVIHRSAFGPVAFELSRWGYLVELPGPSIAFSLKNVPRLPCSDKMTFLGGIEAGAIAELPRYLPLIRECCDKWGWNAEDMHLYRLRIDYPILHVLHVVNCVFTKYVPTNPS